MVGYVVWCPFERRERRSGPCMKREKREEDYAEALCWSNGSPDSAKLPMYVTRIPEFVRPDC